MIQGKTVVRLSMEDVREAFRRYFAVEFKDRVEVLSVECNVSNDYSERLVTLGHCEVDLASRPSENVACVVTLTPPKDLFAPVPVPVRLDG